jgi:hypothetical protein
VWVIIALNRAVVMQEQMIGTVESRKFAPTELRSSSPSQLPDEIADPHTQGVSDQL